MFGAFFKKPLTHILLIAAVGLLAYSNTFNVPFQWDEDMTIVDNPIVKDLRYFAHPSEAKGFGELYYSFRDRYMGYLSFALNYRFHGLDVKGYHVVNIALHILNSLLVYALLRLTLRTPSLTTSLSQRERENKNGRVAGGEGIALFVALIFVSHPVQTEAVTYIMGRLPLLMWFFYLSSMVLYAKWRLTSLTLNPSPTGRGQGVRVFLYLLSLLSAVLAMKTKENALTLPLSIALYEFMFFTKSSVMPEVRSRASMLTLTDSVDSRQQHAGMTAKISNEGYRRLIYLFPFILTLLIIPLSLLSFERPVGEVIGEIESASRHYTAIPRMDYLFTQFKVLVTYLRLLFLPVNQNFDYDYPVYNSFFAAPVAFSFVFLLSLFSLGVFFLIRSKRGNPSLRLLAWGIFWFFLTLSVESSIFPIPMIISEYRLYVPSVGVFLAVISALMLFAPKRLAIAALAVIVIVFSSAAYARNDLWRSGISLWEDVVKKSPRNATAYGNLGKAYFLDGRTDKAIEQYLHALKIRPAYWEAHKNLGIAYQSRNQNDDALKHYLIALELKPDDFELYNNLGLLYKDMGMINAAVEYLRTAIGLKPDFAFAYKNLGNVYVQLGATDKAIECFETAVRLMPDSDVVHYSVGLSYMNIGMADRAIQHFTTAIKINPDYREARAMLSRISAE